MSTDYTVISMRLDVMSQPQALGTVGFTEVRRMRKRSFISQRCSRERIQIRINIFLPVYKSSARWKKSWAAQPKEDINNFKSPEKNSFTCLSHIHLFKLFCSSFRSERDLFQPPIVTQASFLLCFFWRKYCVFAFEIIPTTSLCSH